MTTDPKYRRSPSTVDPEKLRADLIAAGVLKPGPAFPPRVDDNCLPLPRYKTRALDDAALHDLKEIK